ncbi:DNA polymerase III subunit beta [Blastococcus sp. Marseille-P5729]|uniref:DNA polymerase III subunit beta n=1 Tax=Blastococcus sp. Marseille-P5729 TaxID=2086582 RepID=UPI000D0F7CCE|nr:DNA polymerase III subunit beta [Blastococcus sp. Marseille-P5729]
MKFQVERQALADAVSWVARGLPQRPPMPVLAGILLVVDSDTLTVSSFDYEVSTQMKIDAAVDTAGKTLVSGRLLADITKALPNRPVEISTDGSRVLLRCGTSKFSLPSLPVDDYPALPQLPELAGTVDADEFARVVGTVAVAAGRDETLPMLTGVRVEIEGDTLTFAATDRYRLAVREMTWEPAKPGQSTAVLVPAKMLSDTAKTLAGTGRVDISLSDSADGLIGFSGGDRHTTTRLLDPDFPPFRKLLPTESQSTADIETPALVEAVRRVALVAERGTPVQLAFEEGTVTLTVAGDDEGSAEESLPTDLSGDPIRIGFNPHYLLDGLGAVGADQVRLSFLTSTKPAVLSPVPAEDAEPDSYRYLIMPMRLPG